MIEETRYKETTPTSVPRMGMGVGVAEEHVEWRTSEPTFIGRSVAWSPIWSGVVTAVAIQFILMVLGTAIGLSVIRATQPDTPQADTFGAAAGIWWVLSTLVALFAGGWVAGYLAGPRASSAGPMHGFLMWCVVTTLSLVVLATTGGALLGGGLNALAARDIQSPQPNFSITSRNDSTVTGDERTPSVARGAVGVAWWTLAVLLLSAGAAVVGGVVGQKTTEEGNYNRTERIRTV